MIKNKRLCEYISKKIAGTCKVNRKGCLVITYKTTFRGGGTNRMTVNTKLNYAGLRRLFESVHEHKLNDHLLIENTCELKNTIPEGYYKYLLNTRNVKK